MNLKSPLLSREKLIKVAEELDLDIEFDSPTPGVTTRDSDGNIVSHKNWDEIWDDICNTLGFETDNSLKGREWR